MLPLVPSPSTTLLLPNLYPQKTSIRHPKFTNTCSPPITPHPSSLTPTSPSRSHHHFPHHSPPTTMLRRTPTPITLTTEDIAAYEDRRLASLASQQTQQRTRQENTPTTTNPAHTNGSVNNTPRKGDGKVDPNDELKPLPGDRPRIRSGVGSSSASALGREERIMGR